MSLFHGAGFASARLLGAVAQILRHLLVAVGALVLFSLLALYTNPQLIEKGENFLYAQLHDRKVAVADLDVELQAHERVTAVSLRDLSEEQAAAAYWLSRKYKVATEPMGALVAEAYALGEKRNLDPALILSVVAIESRFNPFAQSAVGAQGLMQVMTRVHEDKYTNFGGVRAAFDPVSNMQVGSLILKDCIDRFGGVQQGLVCYVGAAKLPNDGGYSSKVLAEHTRLKNAMNSPAKTLSTALRAERDAVMANQDVAIAAHGGEEPDALLSDEVVNSLTEKLEEVRIAGLLEVSDALARIGEFLDSGDGQLLAHNTSSAKHHSALIDAAGVAGLDASLSTEALVQ